jgi:hypothetical protein
VAGAASPCLAILGLRGLVGVAWRLSFFDLRGLAGADGSAVFLSLLERRGLTGAAAAAVASCLLLSRPCAMAVVTVAAQGEACDRRAVSPQRGVAEETCAGQECGKGIESLPPAGKECAEKSGNLLVSGPSEEGLEPVHVPITGVKSCSRHPHRHPAELTESGRD